MSRYLFFTRKAGFFVLFTGVLVLSGWLFHEQWRHLFLQWIFKINQWQIYYQQLFKSHLMALRGQAQWSTWGALIMAGYIYGVLHAAGPGHGKAIISTFVLTQREHYRFALLLSVGGALLQAASAILWVWVSFVVLGWFIRDSMAQVLWLNRLAYGMVVMLGFWIIIKQLQSLLSHEHSHHCGCGHLYPMDPFHEKHDHNHHQSDIMHLQNLRATRWVAMLSVGIRPCSGAVMTLAVAWSWGIPWVGVLTVIAMAVGTATTVSVVALLAVYGRLNIVDRSISKRMKGIKVSLRMVAILGGFLLIMLGILMWQSDGLARLAPLVQPF